MYLILGNIKDILLYCGVIMVLLMIFLGIMLIFLKHIEELRLKCYDIYNLLLNP